ncbi:MAG: amidohydrolase family protein [Pseudomonadota bacterium]
MKPTAATLGLITVIVALVIAVLMLPEPTETAVAATGSDAPVDGLALINARIFDGETVHEGATLLIRDGLIQDLLTEGDVPSGYETLDIEGQTLLPGLIDAHVHAFNSARSDALRYGVTTMLDMFRPPFDFDQTRAERDALEATTAADLFSAGYLATAEGGHGTQYGIAVPTLADAREVDAWVEERLAEGSDYIKIVIESGAAWSGELPTLNQSIVDALVVAAHARGVLAVAHVSTQAEARMAVEAGVDGLVHVFVDEPLDAALARQMAEEGIFIVPTTTVLAGSHGQSGRGWIEEEATMAERLSLEQRQTVEQQFPGSSLRAARWPQVPAIVGALHDAGVTLLAGSDAPNPATAHGASLLHELKLLNDAGLTPIEALRSATSIPADRFGLEGRGCLQAGCRADVVWVAGNPLADIDDIRQLRAVWKNGSPVSLETESASVAGTESDSLAMPMDLHGSGQWMPSSDNFMGGQSLAEVEMDDAENEIRVSGQLNPGFAFPYAGAMWNPGATMMAAVNVTDARTLSFTLEADQGTYQLMLFSGENMMAPPIQTEIAVGMGTVIDLGEFSGLDPSRLRAIGFYAVGGDADVAFSIRDARLQ